MTTTATGRSRSPRRAGDDVEKRLALDVALDMMQRPLLAKHAQRMPLPVDVLQLIRIAAGSEEDIVWASRTRARRTSDIQEAAVTFLRQVLFYPSADSYRLVGLMPPASAEQLHEHRRWLLKWLHPDRNRSKWESQLFQRVMQAAQDIQERLSRGEAQIETPANRAPRAWRRRPRATRRAPHIPARSDIPWRTWTARQLRRGCYLALIAGLLAIGWRVWDGQPIAQALGELSSGRALWLSW